MQWSTSTPFSTSTTRNGASSMNTSTITQKASAASKTLISSVATDSATTYQQHRVSKATILNSARILLLGTGAVSALSSPLHTKKATYRKTSTKIWTNWKQKKPSENTSQAKNSRCYTNHTATIPYSRPLPFSPASRAFV